MPQLTIPIKQQKIMLSKDITNSRIDLEVSELAIFLGILGKIPQSKAIDGEEWFGLSAREGESILHI